MAQRRGHVGWQVLRLVAVVVFALTAAGAAVGVGFAIVDGRWGAALTGSVTAVLVLAFWRWIALGAAARIDVPPANLVASRLDGSPVELAGATGPDGAPVPYRPGPWGYVGMGLLLAMVVGFMAITALGALDDRRTNQDLERVRDRAVAAARRDHLTIEEVQDAVDRRAVDLGADGPVADLLEVDGAEVVDASTGRGEALVLLRPDRGGPPCVILRIDPDGGYSTRTSSRCT